MQPDPPMTRAERRRLERDLEAQAQLTAEDMKALRRYERKHPGKLRAHFERFPASMEEER